MARAIDRLGVYVDGPLRVAAQPGGDVVGAHPADYPFLVFLGEVGRHFRSLVLFGRAEQKAGLDAFVVLPETIELEQLPYYPDLTQLGKVAAATPGTIAAFWRGLAGLDGVWVLGPHPLGLALVVLARLRRKRVVLCIRQSTGKYFEARLPSRRWLPVLLPLRALDAIFLLLARRYKTVVAGPQLAARYGGDRDGLLVMADSIVSERELATGLRRLDWSGAIELLTVGRLDSEKNPLLLVDALAELESRQPGQYRLVWVGGGPFEEPVRRRAAELGVADRLELRGWIPFGPELLDLYRLSHLFVHVSLTEGVPRVLFEAMACATPIVATDVGGVRRALDEGRAGALVPPNDRDALVGAIERVARDEALRERLVSRGLELARERTLEAQACRVARFIAGVP
jgi:glycosyltransferase involved in cell wall biosynthesis